MESTVKSQRFGKFEIARFGYFAEEMKAAPRRFCSYLNRDKWSEDNVKDLGVFLRKVYFSHSVF